MSYVKDSLATGEEIVMAARFNWTFWAPTWFWLAVSVLPLAYAGYLDTQGTLPGDRLWVFGLSAVPVALALALFIGHWVYVRTTEIAVTSSRFIFKKGLVSRNSNEISLNKIEEINLHQSVWGRLFGYGQLVLQGTGVGVIKTPDIDNPIEFRRAIESAKSRMRQAPDDREYPQQPVPQERTEDKAPAAPAGFTAASAQTTVGKAKKSRKVLRRSKRQQRGAPQAPNLPQKLR
ncbi:MAG: PH domain-containing protein [Pseudomonadota bacterium]